MTTYPTDLDYEYAMARAKREVLGDALEEARAAFESIKDMHEEALKREQDAMAALIKSMADEGFVS